MSSNKILNSVVMLTEQRNSVSLAHSVLATLAEMLPLTSASLYHYHGSGGQLVAKLEVDEQAQDIAWISQQSPTPCPGHKHSETQVRVTRVKSRCYQCDYPIPISENQSARLSLTIGTSPYKFEMLIDGFSKIYRNYLLLLHENERDKLTGLLNRKTLEERMKFFFDFPSANEDDDEKAWIVILDLDHFKRINDLFGHMIGDEILLLFAQYMQCSFSSPKQLFRFGGEEFLILFPPDNKDQIIKEIEQFRHYIGNTAFPQVTSLTFSAGVCSYGRHELLTTVLDKADKALYYAKEKGRDQTRIYETLIESGELEEDNYGEGDVELF